MTSIRAPGAPAAPDSAADARRDPALTASLAPAVRRHAARTCYLVGSTAIAARRAGEVRLHHLPYGAANGLCRDAKFWDQPAVIERPDGQPGDTGYTGYLLDAHTVLTCWHGWEHFSQRAQFAIFGYALQADGHEPTRLPATQLRAVVPQPVSAPPPREVAADPRHDWVLLRLEHPVTHLGTLVPPQFATPRRGAPVYTLGHPGGLPLKLTAAGTVLEVADGLFHTDLDTFTGNSGSPVFDARHHALVGLVVAGKAGRGDFAAAPARGCYVANHAVPQVPGQLGVAADAFAAAAARR